MRATRHLLTAAAVVAALGLTGCGDDDPAATTPEETTAVTPTETAESPAETVSEPDPGARTVAVTIEGDSALPIAEQVEMRTGQALTIAVDSDRPGELHVHSSPEQVIDFPAGASEHALVFDKPGTVDIEEHESGVLLVRVLVR